MENNKKNKILVLTVAVVVVLFLFITPMLRKTERENPTTPYRTINPGELKLLETRPQSGTVSIGDPILPLEFVFDQDIDKNSVVAYEKNSLVKIKGWVYDRSPDTITILPEYDSWKPNTDYTIIITNDLRSITGAKLKDGIIFNYKDTNEPPKDIMVGEPF